MISIRDISKSYDDIRALNHINLEVKQGEIFGLIGPDGAGKTTLFRILTTLLLPDSGDADVAGYNILKDVKKIRSSVGYMPGKFSLYQDLSIKENLTFFATVFGASIEENYDLIKDIYIQLEPFKNRRAGKLSGGMKQKLALCCALIHRPKVLFLDEPTTGVDAVSRQEFWSILSQLKEQNITILVSTPYMNEAALCDRIALIDSGKILSIDTPVQITTLFDQPLYQVKADDYYQSLLDLRKLEGVARALPFGEYIHLTTSAQLTALSIHDFLVQHNHNHIQVDRIKPGIEDVFLHLLDQES